MGNCLKPNFNRMQVDEIGMWIANNPHRLEYLKDFAPIHNTNFVNRVVACLPPKTNTRYFDKFLFDNVEIDLRRIDIHSFNKHNMLHLIPADHDSKIM